MMQNSFIIKATCGTLLCYQINHSELLIVEFQEAQQQNEKVIAKVLLEFEVVSYTVSLGPNSIAIWSDNKGHFKNFRETSEWTVRNYMGFVAQGHLNGTTALVQLTDGRVYSHPLVKSEGSNGAWVTKPKEPATAVALLDDFAITSTASGSLNVYKLPETVLVSSYEHGVAITNLVPQPLAHGIDIIFMDKQGKWFVYLPLNAAAVPLQLPSNTEHATWAVLANEDSESNWFLASSPTSMHFYAFIEHSIRGPMCLPLGETAKPRDSSPPMLFLPQIGKCLLQTNIQQQTLVQLTPYINRSHLESAFAGKSASEAGKLLQRLYLLKDRSNLEAAFGIVQSAFSWQMLSNTALSLLDLRTTARIQRKVLQQAARGLMLQPLYLISEHRRHLAGRIAVLLDEFELAKQLFQHSDATVAALIQLESDLGNWSEAIRLAENHTPDNMAKLFAAFAAALERQQEFVAAQDKYKQALYTAGSAGFASTEEREQHELSCSAGLTRTTLQLGETVKGVQMLTQTNDKHLLRECGLILERLKQPAEAATLFERAEAWDRVLQLYISSGQLEKAEKLLTQKQVDKNDLFAVLIAEKYAEMKNYDSAIHWFQFAKAYDRAINMCLELKHDLNKAVSLVRESQSRYGARLIANHFLKTDNVQASIEFCALARLFDDAMSLAQQSGKAEFLAGYLIKHSDIVKDPAVWVSLARILGNYPLQQGVAWMFAGDFESAASALQQAFDTPDLKHREDMASVLVGFTSKKVPEGGLELIETVLNGPNLEWFKFLFAVALQRREAAVQILEQRAALEREEGNFRKARDVLRDGYMQLRAREMPFPAALMNQLLILHSYLLMKILVKLNANQAAGWLALRVADNIELFSAKHRAGILAFAALQCYKIKLGKSALQYAGQLMDTQYRSQLGSELAEKIEYIIRNPIPTQPEMPVTPCPYCKKDIPILSNSCGYCFAGAKSLLPFCIATGVHMSADGASQCPSCNFLALWQPFKKLLMQTENVCPMCTDAVPLEEVLSSEDPLALFHLFQGSIQV